MLVGILYPSKQAQETFVVEVDFAADLSPGETIQTATVTALERTTGLNSTDTFLSGSPAIDASTVSIRTVGGTAGETHRLQFTIHTAAPFSNVIQHELDVPVEDFQR